MRDFMLLVNVLQCHIKTTSTIQLIHLDSTRITHMYCEITGGQHIHTYYEPVVSTYVHTKLLYNAIPNTIITNNNNNNINNNNNNNNVGIIIAI